MLRQDVEEDEENPDTMSEKIIKYGHNVGEPEIKRIESRHDAEEPKTKGRDQVRERCWRTPNKRKGSNLGTLSENLK